MGDIFLLVFLLAVLFLLSRQLTNLIYHGFFHLLRHHTTAIHALTILVLPGTLLHELAHLCTAWILRVPAGKLTLMPRIEHDGEVTAGSVSVAKTDPFRLTLIGLAPIPVGLLFLHLIVIYLLPTWPTTINQRVGAGVGIYLLGAISCSLFSSKKDLKALLVSGPIVLILGAALYYLGVRISLAQPTTTTLLTTIHSLNRTLLWTVALDIGMWGILALFVKILNRR